MPDATVQTLNLDGLSPAELEQRRRDIVKLLSEMPGGYDDPNVPTETLHELAVITGALRRRTAGPPKARATSKAPTKKVTVADLDF